MKRVIQLLLVALALSFVTVLVFQGCVPKSFNSLKNELNCLKNRHPYFKIGLNGELEIFPFSQKDTLVNEVASVQVRVFKDSPDKKNMLVFEELLQGDKAILAKSSSLVSVKWDTTIYTTELTYTLKDGTTCQCRTDLSDGIIWVDIVMKNTPPGDRCAQNDAATQFYSQTTGTQHGPNWVNGHSVLSGKVKLNIGTETIIFDFDTKDAFDCNTSHSLSIDDEGYTVLNSGVRVKAKKKEANGIYQGEIHFDIQSTTSIAVVANHS
jgi:hypothetical protein